VRLAGDERAWGRPWHVPTDCPASLREVVRYQFAAPFVVDPSEARNTFDLTPPPFDDGIATTVAWWRADVRAAA
jgi:hypothetical protein